MLKKLSTELIPSFAGMLWVDSNNILRVDSIGAGVIGDFVTVLPQHTTSGEHGPKVIITQTTADNALAITKGNINAAVSILCATTNAGRAIDVLSLSNIEPAVYIAQNGASTGIVISKTNTAGGHGISIANSGTGYGLLVEQKSTVGNPGIYVTQASADTAVSVNQNSNGIALAVIKTNTGTGNVIQVTNDGTGIGINVNQNGNANGLYVGKSDTGSASAIAIENSSSGNAINVTQVGNAIALSVVKSGTGAGNVIQVTNSGTGAGINVDQNSNANGLSIGKSNTGSASVIAIRNSGSGPAVNVDQIGAGAGLAISNSNTGYGIIVEQKHTGANAGLYVSQSSSDNTVVLNKIGTSTGSVIDITNSGVGYDIDGNASNWHVDKDGNAVFNTILMTNKMVAVFDNEWTNSVVPFSTGALGFTPRFVLAIFVGRNSVETAEMHSMSCGFAIATGARAVTQLDHQNNDNVCSAWGNTAIAGIGQWGGASIKYTLQRGLVVTSFSSSGITITPSGVVTGKISLLVVG